MELASAVQNHTSQEHITTMMSTIKTTIIMIHVHTMQPHTMDMELESEVLNPNSLKNLFFLLPKYFH